MKFYGLYSKKRNTLLGASFDYHDEFGVLVELTSYGGYGDVLWNTVDKRIADRVTENTVPAWYNGSWTTPTYDETYYGELTVVNLNEFEPNS
jgi:hypothetical protein